MNKGIRKEQRYLQQTIGSAGTTYINLNKNNANMHLTIPLVEGLSLVYNLLDKDIDTGFGKGLRLNYYNKLTYDETNDKYLIEQADGTSYEYILLNRRDEAVNDNIVQEIKTYFNEELLQFLIHTKEINGSNETSNYKLENHNGDIVNYNLIDKYPLSICPKSDKKIVFEYDTSSLSNLIKIKHLKDNNQVSCINIDYLNNRVDKIKTYYYDKPQYEIRITFEEITETVEDTTIVKGNKMVVKYYKYAKEENIILPSLLYENQYEFNYNDNLINIKDGLSDLYHEYQIENAVQGKIYKIIEKFGATEGNELSITYRDHFTKIKNKDSSYLLLHYSQDDLPMCEIDSNKMAISYKYDENNKLKYITKPICLENDEDRYINYYDLDKTIIFDNVEVINNTAPSYLGTSVWRFLKANTSTCQVTLKHSGFSDDSYAFVFSYKMNSSLYDGEFKVRIYGIVGDNDPFEFEVHEELLPKPYLSYTSQTNWFYVMIPFTTKRNFDQLKFEFIYNDQKENGYVGGIKLLKINYNLEEEKKVKSNTDIKDNILYRYEYNDKHQISKINTSLGNIIEYLYDERGNIQSEIIKYKEEVIGLIEYDYDNEDNLISITDGTCTKIEYLYEDYETERSLVGSEKIANRVFEIIVPVTNGLRKIEYLYDKYDNLCSLRVRENDQLDYNYINYNSKRMVKESSYNTKKPYLYSYDDLGRLETIKILEKKEVVDIVDNSDLEFAEDPLDGDPLDGDHECEHQGDDNTLSVVVDKFKNIESYTYYSKQCLYNKIMNTNLLSSINYSGDDSYKYTYDNLYNLKSIEYFANSEESSSENQDVNNCRYYFKYYKDNFLKKATSVYGESGYSVEYKYDANDLLTNMKYTKPNCENDSLNIRYDYDRNNKLTSKKYTLDGEQRIGYYQDFNRAGSLNRMSFKDLYYSTQPDLIKYVLPKPFSSVMEKINGCDYDFSAANIINDNNNVLSYFYDICDPFIIKKDMETYKTGSDPTDWYNETIMFLYKPDYTSSGENLRFLFSMSGDDVETSVNNTIGLCTYDNNRLGLYFNYARSGYMPNELPKIYDLDVMLEKDKDNFIAISYSAHKEFKMMVFKVYINGVEREFTGATIIDQPYNGFEKIFLYDISIKVDSSKRVIGGIYDVRDDSFNSEALGKFSKVLYIANKMLSKEELWDYYLIYKKNDPEYLTEDNELVTSNITYDLDTIPDKFTFIPFHSNKNSICDSKPVDYYSELSVVKDNYYFSNDTNNYSYLINQKGVVYNIGGHNAGFVSFKYVMPSLENVNSNICVFSLLDGYDELYGYFVCGMFIEENKIIIKKDSRYSSTPVFEKTLTDEQALDIVVTRNYLSGGYDENVYEYTFYINGEVVTTKVTYKPEYENLYICLGRDYNVLEGALDYSSMGAIEYLSFSNEGLELDSLEKNCILSPDMIKTLTFYDSLGRVVKKQICKVSETSEHLKTIGDDKIILETTYEYDHETNLIKKETHKYNGMIYETAYTYDNLKNIISQNTNCVKNNEVINDSSYEYQYDSNSRIKSAKNLINDQEEEYHYNENGNLSSLCNDEDVTYYTYSSTYPDLLTEYGQYEIIYGANNNIWLPSQLKFESNLILQYYWEGKTLVSVENHSTSNKYTYQYDHNGMRVKKQISNINGSSLSESLILIIFMKVLNY